MGIYRPGPAVGAISGNVGGASFANPRGSAVIRKPRRPSPNLAPGIKTQQANRTVIAQGWQTLSADQRAAWRHFANINPSKNRLGVSRSISGWNMYSKHAAYALLVAETPATLPPATITPPAVNVVTFAADVTTTITASFANPGSLITVEALIYAHPLYRETLPKFNRDWSFITKVSGTNVNTFNITIPYNTVFPLIRTDQTIAFRWLPLSIDSHAPFQPFDELITVTF